MISEAPVVTGWGIVSPIGIGRDAFTGALLAGEHGIRRIERFPVNRYKNHLAGAVSEEWIRTHVPYDGPLDPAALMAIAAAREAWDDARLEGAVPRERIAVVLGTSAGGFASRSIFELGAGLDEETRQVMYERCGYHQQTAAVAEAIGATGPRVTISTACTSATHAVASAALLLDGGDADVVLVGGVDVLIEAVFAGFHAMGAMSAQPCAPFSTPVGMTVGEGAGFLVVERSTFARDRGARVRCAVNGFASSCDAHHATAPDPVGGGLSRALQGALADAAIDAADVGWISAHGTGTEPNDAAEWLAIQRTFGDRAADVPVSAAKSFFGHALGAAGILELAAAMVALEHQVVPPTLHHAGPRFKGTMDTVATTRARPLAHRHVLKSSSAFGGLNAAVVVSSASSPRAIGSRDDVVVVGTSVAGPHGLPFSELDAIAATMADDRLLDGLGRHLTVLARKALDASHIEIRGPLRDRTGIVVGASTMAWDTLKEFWDVVRKRGYERASVPAFSRTVMNAPAGAMSRAIGIRGHTSVIAAGALSSSMALVEAVRTLERGRRELDLLVVGSANEAGPAERWHHARRHTSPMPDDTGSCIVLARRAWALEAGAPRRARIGGVAISGPEGLGAVLARTVQDAKPDIVVVARDDSEAGEQHVSSALSMNGLGNVPRVDLGDLLGYGYSNDLGSAALVTAVERLLEDGIETALVVAYADTVGGAVLTLLRECH